MKPAAKKDQQYVLPLTVNSTKRDPAVGTRMVGVKPTTIKHSFQLAGLAICEWTPTMDDGLFVFGVRAAHD